jgi:hypothetical protein
MSKKCTIKQIFTFSPDHIWPQISLVCTSQGWWIDTQISKWTKETVQQVDRVVLVLSFIILEGGE